MASRYIARSLFCFYLVFSLTASADAVIWSDDFTDGLNLPWLFIDDFANSPPDFVDVTYDDDVLKFVGSATAFEEDDFDVNLSATGYVGLQEPEYFFENEVHVTATFTLLENVTLGHDESTTSNNDTYVVARGEGLTGYIFALDTERAAADLVRVDDGAVVTLGDEAILRDIPDIDQDGTYTLRLSAIDSTFTGQVFDESMKLLGEVTVEDETYENGWTGVGAAVNDEGDELLRTLIAASVDNFIASDTLDINVDPPTIDELTAAIIAKETDSRFDIDDNGSVNSEDRVAWVHELTNTYFGDSNLDGEFNSADFVVVFTAGEYEDDIEDNSLWADGDWDGDGDFDSGDFVLAFTDGGYEIGPREAVTAVPEPSSLVILIAGLLAIAVNPILRPVRDEKDLTVGPR